MKKSFLFLALTFSILLIGITSCSNSSKSEQTEEKEMYQCPMDCEKGKIDDKPGQCSICGMELEKMEGHPSDDSTHHSN
jgi:hypothetical protein